MWRSRLLPGGPHGLPTAPQEHNHPSVTSGCEAACCLCPITQGMQLTLPRHYKPP